MSGLYIAALVATLVCLSAIDHHHKLVFFKDAKRAIKVFVCCMALFVSWDVAGIVLGIFFTGDTNFLLGIELAQDFPVEELFFLSVLIYTPLLVSQFLHEEHNI